MAWAFPGAARDVDDNGIVRRPLATDAIGNALRAAYGNEPALTEDIACALRKLDAVSGRRH